MSPCHLKNFFYNASHESIRLSYVYFFSWTLRSPSQRVKIAEKSSTKKSPLHPWVPLYYPCISWDKELTWDRNPGFHWKISSQNVDFESRSFRGNGNSSSCIYAWSRAKGLSKTSPLFISCSKNLLVACTIAFAPPFVPNIYTNKIRQLRFGCPSNHEN